MGPLTCGGGINVQAWNAYRDIGGDVMSLGRDASAADIANAMCFDYSKQNSTGSQEESAATLASLYYGWYSQDQVINNWSPGDCGQ